MTLFTGIEFSIFLLIFAWALQQCSATDWAACDNSEMETVRGCNLVLFKNQEAAYRRSVGTKIGDVDLEQRMGSRYLAFITPNELAFTAITMTNCYSFLAIYDFPPNKYIWVRNWNNMGSKMVPIWYCPTGCLVRLLKGYCWELSGLQDEKARKGTTWGRHGL